MRVHKRAKVSLKGRSKSIKAKVMRVTGDFVTIKDHDGTIRIVNKSDLVL